MAKKNLPQALRNPSFKLTSVAADVVLFPRKMACQATARATNATTREAEAIMSEVFKATILRSEGVAQMTKSHGKELVMLGALASRAEGPGEAVVEGGLS